MKKRLLSLVLVFSFVFGTLPVNVLAANGQTERSETITRNGKANVKAFDDIIRLQNPSDKFPEEYVAVKFLADDSKNNRGEFTRNQRVVVYAVNPTNTEIDTVANKFKGKNTHGGKLNVDFPTYSVRRACQDIWKTNDKAPWKMDPENAIKDKKIDVEKLGQEKELFFTAQYVNKKGTETIASILKGKLIPQDIKVWKGDPIDWEKGVMKNENGLTPEQKEKIKDEFTHFERGLKVEGKAKFEDASTSRRDSRIVNQYQKQILKPFNGTIKVTFSDGSELLVENQNLYVSDHMTGKDNEYAPDNAIGVTFKLGEGVKAGTKNGAVTAVEYENYKVKPNTDLDKYKLKIFGNEATIFEHINAEVTDKKKYAGVVWEGQTANKPEDHVVTDSNRVFTAKATKIFTVKHVFKGIDADKQGTPDITANQFPDELKAGAKSLIPEDKKVEENKSYTLSNITTKVTQTIKKAKDEVTAVYEWTFKEWNPNKIENISEDKTVTGIWERRQATSAAPDVTTPKEGDKTIKGKGVPGSKIVVKDKSDKPIGNTTVEQNGTWEVKVPKDKSLKENDKIKVTQTEDGKKPNTKDVTVKKDKPTPSKPSNPTKPTTPSTTDRVHGKNRIETAIEISKKYYGQAERVIIVDASNFPDAMAASALAKQLKAPILLTNSNNLDSRVAAEIKRLGAHNVTVIGGKSSVSDGALNQLSKFDKDGVERISGKDRYETSAQVARRLAKITGKTDHAVIASGEVFADALAVGPYAAREGYPILLVKSNSIPKSISDAITEIGVKKVSIVGGYGSVSKSLEKSLPVVAERLSGKTRYETAIEIASKGLKTSHKAFVANGEHWMDALVIGPVGGMLNMPILLTQANSAPKSLRDHIAKSKIDKITAIGGTSMVSDKVINELSK
ncbi:cell wall-binding repeat-containing protein [Peptostreptococcus anaerobius]|uniref:cell wall-binding repeat-containing protein n=1 Tax=Peptostreptococcus anaerobius TaxID=1261 RepID=UPI00254A70DE|nr:cell wall-binding repeat-containing protein [Peptostreptococcus anaerobius]MDK8278793.1 cell wall-binding repeat-containing protein [Peptostreptococcus anaerobius]